MIQKDRQWVGDRQKGWREDGRRCRRADSRRAVHEEVGGMAGEQCRRADSERVVSGRQEVWREGDAEGRMVGG